MGQLTFSVLEVIAHRGLHRDVPENTLAAFRRAIEAGADAIELDVHAAKDGTLVVHHDPVPGGTPEEPNLRGRSIAELTALEVARFDLGRGARIPTLTNTLDVLRGRATIYVEVKATGAEAEIAREIRTSGATCAVHSFDHRIVARFAELAPEIPRGLLQTSRVLDPASLLATARARDLWQQADLADRELVEIVHAAGGRVIAWTANTPAQWARLVAAGADGICTDASDALVGWRATRPHGT